MSEKFERILIQILSPIIIPHDGLRVPVLTHHLNMPGSKLASERRKPIAPDSMRRMASPFAAVNANSLTGPDVLIYQNRVPVRVYHHQAGRAGRAFVRLCNHLYAARFELALQLSNVREIFYLLGIASPTRVEGQNILLEHALKKPYRVVAILHNQPILRLVSHEDFKTQLFVKEFRRFDIFNGQANREGSQLHNFLLSFVPDA